MIRYLIVLLAYFALPQLQFDTGYYIVLLLVLFPGITFILGLFSGMKFGFEWLFPVGCGLLFIPFVYFFYNSSALVYCFIYFAAALIGELLGGALKGHFMKTQDK